MSAISSCMMNMTGGSAALAASGHMSSFDSSSARPGSALSIAASIENIVNPLGTVTTVVRSAGGGGADPMTDSFQSQDIVFPDQYTIHENCDEALFRPVVTIVEQKRGDAEEDQVPQMPPVRMSTNLIVPVIVPTMPAKLPLKEQIEGEEVKVVVAECEKPQERAEVVEVGRESVVLEEVKEPPVVVPEVKATKQQQQQQEKKNKRNKEKTPPLPPPQQQQKNAMITSTTTTGGSEEINKPAGAPTATKSNGSKGRKSSGQEPKAGKMRKSEKNAETMMNVEDVEESKVELPPPPPPPPSSSVIVEVAPTTDFDHLPEVRMALPLKQEIEVIQDSLMKETIVEAVTVSVPSGGGKKKKNRQKTPPKEVVEPEPEPEEKQDMMVDISESKYDLAACIEDGDADFEAMYADQLVPLEPFDPTVTFESVGNDDDQLYVDESLMTFESPVGEKLNDEEEEKVFTNPDLEKLHKVFTDRKLVFAMCTSLREGSIEESNEMQPDELAEEEESVLVSSAPGWQLEIHEDYMDMGKGERKLMLESITMNQKLTASTGSSEGEVSSSSTGKSTTTNTTSSSGHTTTTATEEDDEDDELADLRQRVVVNAYDEELQPLIKDKEPLEQFDEERRSGDVEGGAEVAVPVAAATSKECTPTPQGKGGQGGSKKKSRKKKR